MSAKVMALPCAKVIALTLAKVIALTLAKVIALMSEMVGVLTWARVTVKRQLLGTLANFLVGPPKGVQICFLPCHLAQPLDFVIQSAANCGALRVALAALSGRETRLTLEKRRRRIGSDLG